MTNNWGNGEALEKIRLYKRQILKELHNQMSDLAKDRFKLIYPNGLDSVPEDKMESTIELCERTVNNMIKKKQINK